MTRIIRERPAIKKEIGGLLWVFIIILEYKHKRINELMNDKEMDFFIKPNVIAMIPTTLTERVKKTVVLNALTIKG